MLSASAQANKPVLTVESFTSSSDDYELAQFVRNRVISAIQETGRVNVVDVKDDAQLKKEQERRKQESAMSDAGRVGEMKTLNANSILKGSIDLFHIEESRSTDKNGKVSVTYKGTLTYTLSITDATNGTVIGQKQFTNTSYGSTSSEAAKEVAEIKITPIKQFILNTFAVGGKIIAVDQSDKGKAKTVYIDLGSADGVKKGQKMEVYKEVEVAGEKSQKLVGEIQVTEVMSAGRSLCKVGKGGDVILSELEKGANLPVKTKEQKSNFFQQVIEN